MVIKRFKIYCDELFYANLHIAYQHFYEGLLWKRYTFMRDFCGKGTLLWGTFVKKVHFYEGLL